MDWMNFWLNNKEVPDHAKAEHYTCEREQRNLQEAELRSAPPKTLEVRICVTNRPVLSHKGKQQRVKRRFPADAPPA
jgi:hypothetical protein